MKSNLLVLLSKSGDLNSSFSVFVRDFSCDWPTTSMDFGTEPILPDERSFESKGLLKGDAVDGRTFGEAPFASIDVVEAARSGVLGRL